MNCGRSSSRFFLFLSTSIVLAAGDHACPIGSVPMPFSLSYGQTANGRRSTRRISVPTRLHTTDGRQWVKAGVFLALWQAGIEQFDELCGIDWDWLAMDGAMSKAPLGGEKTGPNPTERGKSGVKWSVITEGHGVPLAVVIEGANQHDMKLARPTLAEIVVERPAPTEAKPQGMCLDKGYDYNEVRDILREFGITRTYSRAWGRGQGSQEGGQVQSASVVSRTNAFVDESVSSAACQMGQKAGELSRLPPLCLRLDRFSEVAVNLPVPALNHFL
jgi:hypothetical protein